MREVPAYIPVIEQAAFLKKLAQIIAKHCFSAECRDPTTFLRQLRCLSGVWACSPQLCRQATLSQRSEASSKTWFRTAAKMGPIHDRTLDFTMTQTQATQPLTNPPSPYLCGLLTETRSLTSLQLFLNGISSSFQPIIRRSGSGASLWPRRSIFFWAVPCALEAQTVINTSCFDWRFPRKREKVRQRSRCHQQTQKTRQQTTTQTTQQPKPKRTPRKQSETLRFQKSPHASQYCSAMM